MAEPIKDKIVFEFLKFLAKRLWLSTTVTAIVTAAAGIWFSAMWEIRSLFALSATLIVLVCLIHVRYKLLPKDLFLSPAQCNTLARRLKPFASFEIQIMLFSPDGQQYALDIAAAFSEAGCKRINHRSNWMPTNPSARFEICSADEAAAKTVCEVFNSIGLPTVFRKTVGEPNSLSVLIVRPN